MARDPLRILLSIRKLAVEQARQALARCQAAEAEVAASIAALDAAGRRDRATAAAWQDAYQFLDLAVAREAARQAERQALEVDLAAAAEQSEQARGVVTAARTAAEAVAQLAASRAAEAQAEAAKKEQHVLDDMARSRRRLDQTEQAAPEKPAHAAVTP